MGLLDDLVQEAKETGLLKKATYQKKFKKSGDAPDLVYVPFKSRTVPTAFVLLSFESTCKFCGSVFTTHNDKVLLEEKAPNGTVTLTTTYTVPQGYEKLERRVEVRKNLIDACSTCFETTTAWLPMTEAEDALENLLKDIED